MGVGMGIGTGATVTGVNVGDGVETGNTAIGVGAASGLAASFLHPKASGIRMSQANDLRSFEAEEVFLKLLFVFPTPLFSTESGSPVEGKPSRAGKVTECSRMCWNGNKKKTSAPEY